MTLKIKINSLIEMDIFALELSKFVHPSFVIGLDGDLGSGKTTFTQYLAKHIGVLDSVTSPTFTVMKDYVGDSLTLYHMDAYRLHGIGFDYELEEAIFGEGLCVVEWYKNILEIMPKYFLSVTIEKLSGEERNITLSGGGLYENIIKKIGLRYSN
jgi:tRNA threonylcarbamoyladenosine biosynthesis protein TsaE